MKAVTVDAGGKVGRQDLHDDLPTEARVLGDENARHATAAKLTVEPVALAEAGLEAVPQIGHSRQCGIADAMYGKNGRIGNPTTTACCVQLLAGSRRLRATAACYELLLLAQRADGQTSSRAAGEGS